MQLLQNAVDSLKTRSPQVLELVLWPDTRLNQESKLFTDMIPNNAYIQNLLADMEHTMVTYAAAGLSAIQVGVPLRVLVARGLDKKVIKAINPVITSSEGTEYTHEGCLSFPGIYTRILRPASVVISYLDENGQSQQVKGDGLLGRAILHEMDHLNGKTFLDRVGSVQKASMLKKFKKVRKTLFG